MARVYVQSFVRSVVLGVTFQWESSADDASLVSAVEDVYGSTCTVDESSSPPVLNWSIAPSLSFSGSSGSIDLISGCLIQATQYTVALLAVPAGCWLADQYGRPFNLNDLLAG